jgi:EAL domain-containing protein (putative c-di-GMP-specific phosphodiesterase class I)
MLLVVSESLGRTQVLIDVARELSLTFSHFANRETLERLVNGPSRRFVLLGEADVSDETAAILAKAAVSTEFGIIVCAYQDALRDGERAGAAEALANHDNIEWISPDHDADTLSTAARKCRRRMLKLGKDELENAIIRRELILQYQPKVERSDGAQWTTREAEALVRWRHPEHGLLGPLEFLPEAEAFDLIGPVSEFVLFEAASQLKRWRRQGLELNACINLASSQLNTQDLAKSYQKIVEKIGLSCSNFTFEVTEQDISSSEAPHLRVLNEMRQVGFRISLDDFGVAVSSLGAFEQLPFDEIKIHGSALRRAQENPVALKVLAAVTGLAHNLGISVCAEGVEDNETYEFLRTIECDKMQGFLISEAVMPDIIRKVYRPHTGSAVHVA